MKIELELRKDKPEFGKSCIVLCDDGCSESPYFCEDSAKKDSEIEEGWSWHGTYHANVIGWIYHSNISA